MKKKIIKIFFTLAMIFATFIFPTTPKNKQDNHQAVRADGMISKKVDNYDFYQFKHFNEIKNNYDEYITPLESLKVYQATNGSYDIGSLNISGYDLNYEGYKNPQGSFTYNLYTVKGNQTALTYNFKYPENDNYKIANNNSTVVDNIDIGTSIRTGILMIQKRAKNDNSWTVVKTISINKNDAVSESGIDIEYVPDGEDINRGTYYRFVAAYQYYSVRKENLFTKLYQFYDVMQKVTIYLVTGGTSLKFSTNTTRNQTHVIPDIQYINNPNTTGKIEIGPNKVAEEENIAKLSLEGEINKGTEIKTKYSDKVSEYVYNGGTNKLKLHYENIASDNLNNKRIFDNWSYALITYDYNGELYFENLNKKIGMGMLLFQGNNSDSKWENIISEYDIEKDQETIEFNLSSNFYKDYRLIFISSFIEEGVNFTICNVAYFRVNINTDRYQSAFENGEGIDSYTSMLSYEKGLTLEDGSASFSNLLCVSPSSSYKVEVSYQDGEYKVQEELNKLYEEPGKYRFKVTNDINEISYKTLYIVDIGDDNGKSKYFENGNFIVEENGNNKRLYDPSSSIPSYGIGARFKILGNQFLPGIYGKISMINSEGTLTTIQEFNDLHITLDGKLTKVGQYYVEINSNDPSIAGDHVKFSIRFNIKDEKNFTPKVNYDLLHSGADTSSLMGKGYVVSYQSKGSGRFLFTFPYNQKGLNQAWDFSERMEAIKVVVDENKNYIYKGKKYTSKFDLYTDIHENAKNNISTTLINKNFNIANDEYELGNIVDKTIDHDIYVVSSEEIFKDLSTDLVYVNNFVFQQVRKYETEQIRIFDSAGNEIKDIKYGTNINDYLKETGIYTIEETNWCGTSIYKVAYCKEGQNKTEATIRYFDENNTIVEKVIDQDNIEKITTESLIFKNIVDYIDPVVLVTISYSKDGKEWEEKNYSNNDLQNLIIDKKGLYKIKFTNRLGYSFVVNVEITGDGKETFEPHKDSQNKLSYCPTGYVKEDF